MVCPPYTIFFSVSHSAFSGRHAWVMAVYPHCDVGVDMEPLNRSIQPAVFHRGTHGDPPPLYHPRQRVLAWTQFEALAKCRGAGIRFPIPRRFPNRFGSFLWKGWVVTLACSAAMPSIHVVPVDGDSGGASNSVQHSDQRLDDAPPWSNSFVLIGEQMSKMSIVTVEDDPDARNPVALHSFR